MDSTIQWNMIWIIIKQVYQINTDNKIHLIALFIWMLVDVYGTYSAITNVIINYKIID